MLTYLRLVLFAVGLLVGLQVPGFVRDYTLRVQAHYAESEQSLSGFRDTAAQFFAGDLEALVLHYQRSDDPVMLSDAASVAHLVARAQLLNAEREAMQGPWYRQFWHVLTQANPELLRETLQAYQYQVLLTPQAMLWGVACALLLAWSMELLAILLAAPFNRRRRTQVLRR